MKNSGIHLAPLHQYACTEDVVRLQTGSNQITVGGPYMISQDSGVIYFRVTDSQDNSTVLSNQNSISLSDDAYVVLYLKAGQWVRSSASRGNCVRLEPM